MNYRQVRSVQTKAITMVEGTSTTNYHTPLMVNMCTASALQVACQLQNANAELSGKQ